MWCGGGKWRTGNSKAVMRYFCAAVAIKRPSICSSSIKLMDGDTYSGRISRSLDRTGSAPSTVKNARSSSRLRASNGQSLWPSRTRLIFCRSVGVISSDSENSSSYSFSPAATL